MSKHIKLAEGYVLRFMLPVGKLAKPAWDCDDRFGEDHVVAYDTF
ncbi:MAG: hypothetical protein ACSHX7_02845 [Luteolibacter sp.]